MFLRPRSQRSSTSTSRQITSLTVCALMLVHQLLIVSPVTVRAAAPAGAVSITTLGAPIVETFDSLATSGTTNSTPPPVGFAITETGGSARDNEQYAADNGGSGTGDTYSYGASTPTISTERALGTLRSGTLIPIFGACYTNNTGSAITSLAISYTGEQWRLGTTGGRTDRLDFSYSTNSTNLTDGTYTDVDALDFTTPNTSGTSAGSRNGNDPAFQSARSASITGLSIAPGATFFIRWSDSDASGADDGLAVDGLSVTANGEGGGGADAAPTVVSNTPTNNATGVAINSDITINFSEDVTVSTSSFTISCPSGARTFALTGSGASYTLNPDTDFGNSEQCTVTVVANQVSDVDTNDPPDNMAADFVFSFTTVAASGACGDPFTAIPVIQGSGTASPRVGNTEETEGVVTGDFQGTTRLNGFFIQAETSDDNTATSDGIFISSNTDVSVGQRVRVRGTVVEEFNQTIINTATVTICSGMGAITPTDVMLPATPTTLEQYEGMLVRFNQTLFVSSSLDLGRFGELTVSANSRLYIPTNSIDPNDNPPSGTNTSGSSNVPAVTAQQTANNNNRIIIDDGSSLTNNSTPGLTPIPFIPLGDATIRGGDTVTNPVGNLGFGFSNYRLQPTTTLTFTPTNPRTAAPAVVGTTNLRAASFNVGNFFVTVNDPNNRGADTAAEFTRQRDKIVAALVGLDADVIGLIELEKANGSPPAGTNRAAADLAAALTADGRAGSYEAVPELAMLRGTDPDIKNGIIFRTSGPTAVTRVGDVTTDEVAPAGTYSRDPVAQTFQASNGEQFTIVVNHLRSKSCPGSGGDADMGDGQACFNDRRRSQAQAIRDFVNNQLVATDPDVLVVGDLNAYAQEDPIDVFRAANYVDVIERYVSPADKYSFLFNSEVGLLDHAFATGSLSAQTTGATIWHINVDEPAIFDYDTDDRTGDSGGGGKPDDRYQRSPYRSSDHDPVLIGLNLAPIPPQPVGRLTISEFRLRGTGGAADEFVEIYNNTDAAFTVQATDGSSGYALVASDAVARFTIPNGTVIPARGHYLGVNSNGYSLSAYPSGNGTTATGDATYTTDIPDNAGIALFSTSTPANFTDTYRLDSVGSTSEANTLYKEGAGYPAISSSNIEYSFYRDINTGNGLSKDTNANATDFLFVDPAGTSAGAGQRLGAPGPENLSSPVIRNGRMSGLLLDATRSLSSNPNRVRKQCTAPDVEECDPARSRFGTISIRRRIVNNTGVAVTRLRFRVVDTTTFPAPTGIADVRAITSSQITVSSNDPATCQAAPGSPAAPCMVTVEGTTLETPPAQAIGGGYNATLSAGTITLTAPLAPGASVNVQFLIGVQQTGTFRFLVNIEALPGF